MSRVDVERIRSAWQGRISGCQLGKPVEALSMMSGFDALQGYLERAGELPLRDYVPLLEGEAQVAALRGACRGHMEYALPDDDINYSVLALMMLEEHGLGLTTEDVARAWLLHLPFGMTFTAERAAYKTLTERGSEWFAQGAPPEFDLAECAENPFNDWIGAQIRADVYGWVLPGRPEEAARLARVDAELSHREAGVHGAMFVAAMGAALPVTASVGEAVDVALEGLPEGSDAAEAVEVGRSVAGKPGAVATLHARYADLSPVHTLNNLALVVWALLSGGDDFSAAIGDAVAAGWDTDCNGATVGGLWGVTGRPVPRQWTDPWNERVGVSLAGQSQLRLSALVDRTVAVARHFERELGVA